MFYQKKSPENPAPAIEPNRPAANLKPEQNQKTPSRALPPQTSTTQEDGVVLIGKGTHVTGTIDDCRVLDVRGVLEADVRCEILIVREGGGIRGTIHTDNAEIHGVVEGAFTVHEHLEISGTGDVSGTIYYRTLAVAKGSKLRGDIQTEDVSGDIEPPAAVDEFDFKHFESGLEAAPLNGSSTSGSMNGTLPTPEKNEIEIVKH